MSEDDALFGYRFFVCWTTRAAPSVSEARRVFGIRRSTFVWKRGAERHDSRFGAACAGTDSTPARNGSPWSPATRRHTSRRASPSRTWRARARPCTIAARRASRRRSVACSPADERRPGGAAQADPRGVPAPNLCPLPAHALHRSQARPRNDTSRTTTSTASTTAASAAAVSPPTPSTGTPAPAASTAPARAGRSRRGESCGSAAGQAGRASCGGSTHRSRRCSGDCRPRSSTRGRGSVPCSKLGAG
jgi:hypothetical protein